MPKFPSDETLICKPVPEHQKEELPNADKALEQVLAVINDKELVWESCPKKGYYGEDYILNRKKTDHEPLRAGRCFLQRLKAVPENELV